VGGAGQVGHVRVLDGSARAAAQAPRAAPPQATLDRGFADLGRQGVPQGQQVAQQGRQQSNFAQADAGEITTGADNFLLYKVITGGANRWLLSNSGRQFEGTGVEGDTIKLTWKLRYGAFAGFEGAPTCKVVFTFEGTNEGGVKTYKLAQARLDGWKGFLGNRLD